MARPLKPLPRDVLLRACEQLLDGVTASEIAAFIARETHQRFSREQVYPLLKRAERLGLLRLVASLDEEMGRWLAKVCGLPAENVKVVQAKGPQSLEHVAKAGARMAFDVIQDLRASSAPPQHVGLGAGRTSRLLCRELGALLKSEFDRPATGSQDYPIVEQPELVFHALTGGWAPDRPLEWPVAHFNYFIDEERPYAGFIGLSAPPVVRQDLFDQIRSLPLVQPCFDNAKDIDIILTSISGRDDEHGSFGRLMAPDRAACQALDAAGWIGDVQFLPYSRESALQLRVGLRPFVVVTIDDLVQLAGRKGKAVVLVAGPCGMCSRTKARALVPLILNPGLRVFSHLVCDIRTAEELSQLLVETT